MVDEIQEADNNKNKTRVIQVAFTSIHQENNRQPIINRRKKRQTEGFIPKDSPDMDNRDPNELNSHVKVNVEDISGET